MGLLLWVWVWFLEAGLVGKADAHNSCQRGTGQGAQCHHVRLFCLRQRSCVSTCNVAQTSSHHTGVRPPNSAVLNQPLPLPALPFPTQGGAPCLTAGAPWPRAAAWSLATVPPWRQSSGGLLPHRFSTQDDETADAVCPVHSPFL